MNIDLPTALLWAVAIIEAWPAALWLRDHTPAGSTIHRLLVGMFDDDDDDDD